MSWQLLVGLSVVLYSVNGLLHRTLMKNEKSDAYAQAVAFTGLVGLFSLIVLLLRGGFKSPLFVNELPLFLLLALLTAMAMVFGFKGLKLVDASEYAILLTSSKLWLISGAILFLRESFTVTKLLGAIIILFGVVLAEWKKQAFTLNKGAIYVLLAAIFFAAGEILSDFIVRNFDVLSFMVYATFLITTILIVLRPRIIKKLSFYFEPKHALNIIITSVNDGLATFFSFTAYQMGRNALQIGPLMATQTLLTVLLAIIILNERDRVPQKIIGSLAAVIGTILLLL